MSYIIQPFGERAVLVTLHHSLRPSHVRHALVSALGVDARCGLDTVVISSPNLPPNDAIAAIIEHSGSVVADEKSPEVTVSVRYDGDDLHRVATGLGITVGEVISAHTNTVWSVVLVGFAPGFPYLAPRDTASPFAAIPRLSTPRTRVPAGAVAVAVGLSAIYPTAMPGGWMLLGQTDVSLFDPRCEPPSLLRVGDTVRFIDVTT